MNNKIFNVDDIVECTNSDVNGVIGIVTEIVPSGYKIRTTQGNITYNTGSIFIARTSEIVHYTKAEYATSDLAMKVLKLTRSKGQ